MARKGKIPAFKVGDDWHFDKDAIEKWMNDRHVKAPKKLGTPWLHHAGACG
jgi:hypothetical protein